MDYKISGLSKTPQAVARSSGICSQLCLFYTILDTNGRAQHFCRNVSVKTGLKQPKGMVKREQEKLALLELSVFINEVQ